jgi:hypothetical protein
VVMILTACCVWRLVLAAASISPKAIISYPDSVKRLEAYLAAGDSRRTSHSPGLTSPACLGVTRGSGRAQVTKSMALRRPVMG